MTLDEFRTEMEGYRLAVGEETRALKYPQKALNRLHSLYKRFDVHERAMADEVLAEWVLADDEVKRFDALALIEDFKIATATPALRKLAARLTGSKAPGAPYGLEKVNRILGGLAR